MDVIETAGRWFYSGDVPRRRRTAPLLSRDKKQSDLFPFRAPTPREFDHKQTCSSKKSPKPARPSAGAALSISFRSSSGDLQLVDTTLAPHTDAGFSGRRPRNKAFKSALPAVSIYGPVGSRRTDEAMTVECPIRWIRNLRITIGRSGADPGRVPDQGTFDRGRPLYLPVDTDNPGCLCPRRIRCGRFPDPLCNARSESVFRNPFAPARPPVSLLRGSDRRQVGAELAVKIWRPLLSFLATPEDSLSLATGAEIASVGWTAADSLFTLSTTARKITCGRRCAAASIS